MEWESQQFAWDPQALRARRLGEAEDSLTVTEAGDAKKQRRKRRTLTGSKCQVPGCQAELETTYHKKYHICKQHARAGCVVMEGRSQRFCQKCAQFQRLDEFDGIKRTCRQALQAHNEKRRLREALRRDKDSGSLSNECTSGSKQCDDSRGSSSKGSSGDGSRSKQPTGSGSKGSSSGTATSGQGSDAAQGEAGASAPPPAAAVAAAAVAAAAVTAAGLPLAQEAQGRSLPQGLAGLQLGQQPPLQQQQQQPQQQRQPPPLTGMRLRSGAVAGGAAGEVARPVPSAQPMQVDQQPGAETEAEAEAGQQPVAVAPEQSRALAELHLLPLARPASLGSLSAATAAEVAAAGAAPVAGLAQQDASLCLLPPPSQVPPSPALEAAQLRQAPSAPSAATTALNVGAHQLREPGGTLLEDLLAVDFTSNDLLDTTVDMGLLSDCDLMALTMEGAGGPNGTARPPWQQHHQQLQQHQSVVMAVMAGGGSTPASARGAPAAGGSPLLPQPPQPNPSSQGDAAGTSAGGSAGGPQAPPSSSPPLSGPPATQPSGTAGFGAILPTPSASYWEGLGQLPASLQPTTYISPSHVYRMSLKVFGCTPDMLAGDVRAELELLLLASPRLVEGYIRPGCTHLTVDFRLAPGDAASAAAVPAAELLQALHRVGGMGTAAGNPALLQWQAQLAALGGSSQAGTAGVPALEPRLRVQPACIALPAEGSNLPSMRLILDTAALRNGSSDNVAAALAESLVLCRQAGQHWPVELYRGGSGDAPVMPLSDDVDDDEGLSTEEESDGSDGSDGESGMVRVQPNGPRHQNGRTLPPGSAAASAFAAYAHTSQPSRTDARHPAGASSPSPSPSPMGVDATAAVPQGQELPPLAAVWARPVGLTPGSCEVEVQVPLLGAAASSAAGLVPGQRAVVMSSPAPLLVLRDARAAAEVQRLLPYSGSDAGMDDLLRDIGLAAAFLEAQPHPSPALPPSLVAAAAAAAADFAQQHSMPSLASMLQRAAAAAAQQAATAAASAPAGAASGTSLAARQLASSSMQQQEGVLAEAAGPSQADGPKAWVEEDFYPVKGKDEVVPAEKQQQQAAKTAGAGPSTLLMRSSTKEGKLAQPPPSFENIRAEGMLRDVEKLAASEGASACDRTYAGPSPMLLFKLGAAVAGFWASYWLVRSLRQEQYE